MVMAKIDLTMQEDGHKFIVLCFECRVGIDIDDAHHSVELCSQRRQRHLHIVTEVAVAATEQG